MKYNREQPKSMCKRKNVIEDKSNKSEQGGTKFVGLIQINITHTPRCTEFISDIFTTFAANKFS